VMTARARYIHLICFLSVGIKIVFYLKRCLVQDYFEISGFLAQIVVLGWGHFFLYGLLYSGDNTDFRPCVRKIT